MICKTIHLVTSKWQSFKASFSHSFKNLLISFTNLPNKIATRTSHMKSKILFI